MDSSPAADAVHALMAEYPDFPSPGILFRDLAPVLADGAAFRLIVQHFAAVADADLTAIAGVEARGFTLAAAVAYELGCGVVQLRKPGKLPGQLLTERYALEYADDELQLQVGLLAPGARVLLLDDVLATGGTLRAASRLLERAHAVVTGVGVVLELDGLGGRMLLPEHNVQAITSV